MMVHLSAMLKKYFVKTILLAPHKPRPRTAFGIL